MKCRNGQEVTAMSEASIVRKSKLKLGKKAKITLGVFCMLAVIAICAAAIAAYAKTHISEGTVVLEPEPESALSEISAEKDAILAHLRSLIDKAKDTSSTYIDVSADLFVDDDSIVVDGGTSAEASALKHIKSTILDSAKSFYTAHDGTFGDGYNSLPLITMNSADAQEVSCETGMTDDNGNVTEQNYRYFCITAPDFKYLSANANAVYTTFGLAQDERAVADVLNEAATMFTVTHSDINCTDFTFSARADKRCDRLDYIKISRTYEVRANIVFCGEFEAIGARTVSFKFTSEENYSFTWAGARFTERKLILPVGDDEPLPIEAVIADDATSADYKIAFFSSDKSALAVDKDGNIKGLKVSESPVTVSVVFNYLGNTYKDTCLVYVVNPVEKITVSMREIALSVGSSEIIEYTIAPENATIKSVRWFTEDEAVAAIDSNGRVTAVGAGQTKVYAVTEDGFLKSSCTVTVTK